jgi:hypothetical protein
MSARNYWTTLDLEKDIRYQRGVEKNLRMKARTENNPSQTLRDANTARVRAKASEDILIWRLNNLK